MTARTGETPRVVPQGRQGDPGDGESVPGDQMVVTANLTATPPSVGEASRITAAASVLLADLSAAADAGKRLVIGWFRVRFPVPVPLLTNAVRSARPCALADRS